MCNLHVSRSSQRSSSSGWLSAKTGTHLSFFMPKQGLNQQPGVLRGAHCCSFATSLERSPSQRLSFLAWSCLCPFAKDKVQLFKNHKAQHQLCVKRCKPSGDAPAEAEDAWIWLKRGVNDFSYEDGWEAKAPVEEEDQMLPVQHGQGPHLAQLLSQGLKMNIQKQLTQDCCQFYPDISHNSQLSGPFSAKNCYVGCRPIFSCISAAFDLSHIQFF